MKKMMMIAAMMLMSIGAFAQEAGQMFLKPMVGGTLATLTGDGVSSDNKMKFGLVAGAEFGYHVTDNIALTAGVLYSMQGSGVKNHDDSFKMDYLNIPILFNYYIVPGLAVKAGVQPGFLMRSKWGDADWKDYNKTVDFAIPLGLSYEFSDFVVDARYNLGLTNTLKDKGNMHFDGKAKNSVIMLTLGYKIPF